MKDKAGKLHPVAVALLADEEVDGSGNEIYTGCKEVCEKKSTLCFLPPEMEDCWNVGPDCRHDCFYIPGILTQCTDVCVAERKACTDAAAVCEAQKTSCVGKCTAPVSAKLLKVFKEYLGQI